MKLNKKGYVLIEIIVAFSLAMAIAYYILNLTYKFKNTNEDIYQSTLYLKDKELVTKNIMNDLERGTITSFPTNSTTDLTANGSSKRITFQIKIGETTEYRKLQITKDASGTTITYGKTNTQGGNFVTADSSYYQKKLEKSLIVKSIETKKNNKIATIEIKIESLYDNKNNYNIKLLSTTT